MGVMEFFDEKLRKKPGCQAARLRLEAVPSFARARLRLEAIPSFARAVIANLVRKGATRPLDGVGLDYSQAINPSSHSLLAQRMGEERHSLKRREWLFRASDR